MLAAAQNDSSLQKDEASRKLQSDNARLQGELQNLENELQSVERERARSSASAAQLSEEVMYRLVQFSMHAPARFSWLFVSGRFTINTCCSFQSAILVQLELCFELLLAW